MEISSKEVLRYLGYRGADADERVSSLTKELIALFSTNVVPKSVYGIWDCKIDSPSVEFGGITVKSKNLAGHLADCRSVVLLAATLGTEADTLIRRFSVQDMEKAVIAQAVCAAMIEAYCDEIVDLIEEEFSQRRRGTENAKEEDCIHLTTRFSPGYGDFDIAHQKDILNMLNGARIGLSLTDGYMLVPSKSVTAVIGLSSREKLITKKCERCCTPCALNLTQNLPRESAEENRRFGDQNFASSRLRVK